MSTFEDAATNFCDLAWERSAALVEAICEHPFNQALADGSLDEERFGFYMVQDARYLVGFSRALACAAVRVPDADASAFFAGSAQQALVVESSLHRGALEHLAWGPDRVRTIETSPTCLAYTSFLAAVAMSEPWQVLVASLLPCFWVYHHVGQKIMANTKQLGVHPYADWIATYADEEFGDAVTAVQRIANDAASSTTRGVADRMLDAFIKGCEYEWMFWDSAWHLEHWPTAAWLPTATDFGRTERTNP